VISRDQNTAKNAKNAKLEKRKMQKPEITVHINH